MAEPETLGGFALRLSIDGHGEDKVAVPPDQAAKTLSERLALIVMVDTRPAKDGFHQPRTGKFFERIFTRRLPGKPGKMPAHVALQVAEKRRGDAIHAGRVERSNAAGQAPQKFAIEVRDSLRAIPPQSGSHGIQSRPECQEQECRRCLRELFAFGRSNERTEGHVLAGGITRRIVQDRQQNCDIARGEPIGFLPNCFVG
jgi:hypothetical protein